MQLRFATDRRALIWSLLLFPFLPALAYARPSFAPWLLPFGLYLAYCAGILAHNHSHLPTFHGRRANSLYAAWLSFFYGCPIFVWFPTHLQNHHRYVNGEGDLAPTSPDAAKDTLLTALVYPTRSAVAQSSTIWRYVHAARRRASRRSRQIYFETVAVLFGHAGALALAIALHGVVRGGVTYALALGVPAAFATWSMMFTNYVQHVGCDPTSPDHHSRNFVNPFVNFLVFNGGYHTVHHEHPSVHWSEYAKLHAKRAAHIDRELNQGTIFGYCLRTYFLTPLTKATGRAFMLD